MNEGRFEVGLVTLATAAPASFFPAAASARAFVDLDDRVVAGQPGVVVVRAPEGVHAGVAAHSVLFSWQSLRFLTKVVGPEKVMLGSDYPFPIGDPDPCKVVRAARLTDAEQKLVLGNTAQKIFKIK